MSNGERDDYVPVMLTLGYHLEMVIWEDAGEGVRMNAAEVERRTGAATEHQLARANARLERVRADVLTQP